MKILDKYILKKFLVPFTATFLIVLFVLVMQFLWLSFEDIAGKGVELSFIFKFLYYTALIVTPQALPIGVLLSSIMALGNLAESYEFAAAKSAGISLQRLLRPLIILVLFISGINFIFQNNIFPYAVFKQKNLYINIKKKKPAMALIPGSFNTEIDNYHIKFDEKYGEEDNLLKNVKIYDLSERKGNKKIINAKRGKIISQEGSKYMTLELYDGNYFEDHISYKTRTAMPASTATFETYTIVIEIPDDKISEDGKLKNFQMYNLNQLRDTIPNIKANFDEYIQGRATELYRIADAKKLYSYPDSSYALSLNQNILENFNPMEQLNIIKTAYVKSDQAVKSIGGKKNIFKFKRRTLNKFDIEFYNRIAFSLSCLILFFIGAPLGSIIRKGGFGMPMILAICVYVLYFFTNTLGRNMAEESSISALFGSWIAVLFTVPLGFFLTRRATKDMGIFNIDVFLQPITNLYKKYFTKSEKK